jgi:hypothetical protein
MKAKRVVLSGEHQSFDDIAAHRCLLEQATRDYFSHRSAAFCAQFATASAAEIAEALAQTLREIERTSILSLLAAIEAAFRVDYFERVYLKRKDPVSRACRALHARKAQAVKLDEDLLTLWLHHGQAAKGFIADLRSAFHVRHWLAHGRYWSPRLGRYDDFDTVYTLAVSVSALLDVAG